MTDNLLSGALGPTSIGPRGPEHVAPRKESGGRSFKEILLAQIRTVNQLQKDADKAIASLATGETDNVAEVFMAVRKAGLAFSYMMQIHRKLVEAYDEIMRMRV